MSDHAPAANFRPGPVAMRAAVHAAFRSEPSSHRGAPFLARTRELSGALRRLTRARHATLSMGSGTLANDIIGAQLTRIGPGGVVAVNGEFGERLADAARRLGLRPRVLSTAWGAPLDYDEIDAALESAESRWLWAVHCETSTGVLNSLPRLSAIARRNGARLAIDAISSIGTLPCDLSVADWAAASSGKALGAYPGVAIVLHREVPAPCADIPRYLDLGHALAHDGVPFTQSSNLVDALHAAVTSANWASRFTRIDDAGHLLREGLCTAGFTPLAPQAVASPAVHTIALPPGVSSRAVGDRLQDAGFLLSYESGYLERRNWVQACLMGEWDDDALGALPAALQDAVHVEGGRAARAREAFGVSSPALR